MNEQTQQLATRVVHVHKDDFDVYIGQYMSRFPELKATGWGNPFRPAPGIDAIAKYREWILNRPQLLERLSELRGMVLGCWCAPKGGLPGDLEGHVCHGEVLAALADMTPAMLHELMTAARSNQHQSFQRWIQACKTSAYEMAVEDILGDLEDGWNEDALLKLDGGGCGPVAGGYAYQRKHGRYIVTQFRGAWRTQSFKVRDLITEAKRRMRNTPVQASLFGEMLLEPTGGGA